MGDNSFFLWSRLPQNFCRAFYVFGLQCIVSLYLLQSPPPPRPWVNTVGPAGTEALAALKGAPALTSLVALNLLLERLRGMSPVSYRKHKKPFRLF